MWGAEVAGGRGDLMARRWEFWHTAVGEKPQVNVTSVTFLIFRETGL